MNVSVLALKLLILFLPGIICSFVVDTFTNHKERSKFEFVLYSYVYGLISYGAYWFIASRFGDCLGISKDIVFIKSLFSEKPNVSFIEVAHVCMLSVLLGAAFTFIHAHKLHFRLAHKLRITKKFGELDVWGYLMNSPDVIWITVRDLQNDLMYDGWVQAFSDDSSAAEILLGDVIVYQNGSGNELYRVKSQYLSLDRNNICIEVRGND